MKGYQASRLFLGLGSGGGGITWATPVNSNILSDGDATRAIGAFDNRFASIWSAEAYINYFDIRDATGANTFAEIIGDNTLYNSDLTIISYNAGTRAFGLTISSQGEARFITADSTATSILNIKTGNASTGNSGNINLITGAATGTTGVRSGNLLLNTGTSAGTIAGGSITMSSGVVNGTGSSGNVTVTTGAKTTTFAGATGNVNISTGFTSGTATGVTGNITIQSGTNNSTVGTAVTGIITLVTGAVGSLTSKSGELRLWTGNTFTGTSGNINIRTGTPTSDASTGAITLDTASTTSTNTAHSTGAITLTTGSGTGGAAVSGGIGLVTGYSDTTATGAGGSITLVTGNYDGNFIGGSISLTTGDATAAASGNITIQTGTAASTRGAITLNARLITAIAPSGFIIPKLTSAPTGVVSGTIYYDTTLNQLGRFNGTTWAYL